MTEQEMESDWEYPPEMVREAKETLLDGPPKAMGCAAPARAVECSSGKDNGLYSIARFAVFNTGTTGYARRISIDTGSYLGFSPFIPRSLDVGDTRGQNFEGACRCKSLDNGPCTAYSSDDRACFPSHPGGTTAAEPSHEFADRCCV